MKTQESSTFIKFIKKNALIIIVGAIILYFFGYKFGQYLYELLN